MRPDRRLFDADRIRQAGVMDAPRALETLFADLTAIVGAQALRTDRPHGVCIPRMCIARDIWLRQLLARAIRSKSRYWYV